MMFSFRIIIFCIVTFYKALTNKVNEMEVDFAQNLPNIKVVTEGCEDANLFNISLASQQCYSVPKQHISSVDVTVKIYSKCQGDPLCELNEIIQYARENDEPSLSIYQDKYLNMNNLTEKYFYVKKKAAIHSEFCEVSNATYGVSYYNMSRKICSAKATARKHCTIATNKSNGLDTLVTLYIILMSDVFWIQYQIMYCTDACERKYSSNHQRNTIIILVTVGLCLMVVLAVIMYHLYHKRKQHSARKCVPEDQHYSNQQSLKDPYNELSIVYFEFEEQSSVYNEVSDSSHQSSRVVTLGPPLPDR